jgi:hypothetical protein
MKRLFQIQLHAMSQLRSRRDIRFNRFFFFFFFGESPAMILSSHIYVSRVAIRYIVVHMHSHPSHSVRTRLKGQSMTKSSEKPVRLPLLLLLLLELPKHGCCNVTTV